MEHCEAHKISWETADYPVCPICGALGLKERELHPPPTIEDYSRTWTFTVREMMDAKPDTRDFVLGRHYLVSWAEYQWVKQHYDPWARAMPGV